MLTVVAVAVADADCARVVNHVEDGIMVFHQLPVQSRQLVSSRIKVSVSAARQMPAKCRMFDLVWLRLAFRNSRAQVMARRHPHAVQAEAIVP